MIRATALLILALARSVVPHSAGFQCSLATTYAPNNGCSGDLFDVRPNTTITVCSFDVHLESGAPSTIEVRAVTGGGSWNQPGVTGDPGAWTLLGSSRVRASDPPRPST
ncbi:MAG: hypothetical protein CMJ83_13865 [Planctomycetes bacterium]|nr:hypothetical protein [Planctomycetota bacterium]